MNATLPSSETASKQPRDSNVLPRPAHICLAAGDLKTAWAILDQLAGRDGGDPAVERLGFYLTFLRTAHRLGDQRAVAQTGDRMIANAALFSSAKSPLTVDELIVRIAREHLGWNDYAGARAVAGRSSPSDARDHLLDGIDQDEDRQPPAAGAPDIDPIAEAAHQSTVMDSHTEARMMADLKAGNIADIRRAASAPNINARIRGTLYEVCAMAAAARRETALRDAELAFEAGVSVSDPQLVARMATVIARQQAQRGDRVLADATYEAAVSALQSIQNRNTRSNAAILGGLAESQAESGGYNSAAQWAATLNEPSCRTQVRLALAKFLMDRAAQRETNDPLPTIAVNGLRPGPRRPQPPSMDLFGQTDR